ncbi:hypothetical protein KSP40_PGU011227 [Platanthera guangdongensis]|uniref:Uncharacterized protein n=1 Tax=Platanthera guangdongensis TaxID=2320717 RepID=A0ABR2LMQ4_9ASPA
MASSCLRSLNRSSLSSLRSHISQAKPAARLPPPTSASTAGSTRAAAGTDAGSAHGTYAECFRFIFRRSPVELGSCAGSMYPLHSAVAAARLTSRLSLTSRTCRDLLQGTLCCTSPGL